MVKHKFFYAEEWIQPETSENDEPELSKNKKLRKCYLAKFVINFQKWTHP